MLNYLFLSPISSACTWSCHCPPLNVTFSKIGQFLRKLRPHDFISDNSSRTIPPWTFPTDWLTDVDYAPSNHPTTLLLGIVRYRICHGDCLYLEDYRRKLSRIVGGEGIRESIYKLFMKCNPQLVVETSSFIFRTLKRLRIAASTHQQIGYYVEI